MRYLRYLGGNGGRCGLAGMSVTAGRDQMIDDWVCCPLLQARWRLWLPR